MEIYLKSFLAGAAALVLFVLLILVGFAFSGGIIFRTPTAVGTCLLTFALGFGWKYRRAVRRSSR
jgi:hypothetical protein